VFATAFIERENIMIVVVLLVLLLLTLRRYMMIIVGCAEKRVDSEEGQII
jgi:hypothetical protein